MPRKHGSESHGRRRGRRGSRNSPLESKVPTSQKYTTSEAFENDYLMGFDRDRREGAEEESPGRSSELGDPEKDRLTVENLAARMLNMKMMACLNSWRQFTEVGGTPYARDAWVYFESAGAARLTACVLWQDSLHVLAVRRPLLAPPVASPCLADKVDSHLCVHMATLSPQVRRKVLFVLQSKEAP